MTLSRVKDFAELLAIVVALTGGYIWVEHLSGKFDELAARIEARHAEERASDTAWQATDEQNITAQRATNDKIEDLATQIAGIHVALAALQGTTLEAWRDRQTHLTRLEEQHHALAEHRGALDEIHDEVHTNYERFEEVERTLEGLTLAMSTIALEIGKHAGQHGGNP